MKKVKKTSSNMFSDMSFSDLYTMFMFVESNMNKAAGSKFIETKKLMVEKHNDIQEELYRRAYGRNPYKPMAAEEVVNTNSKKYG